MKSVECREIESHKFGNISTKTSYSQRKHALERRKMTTTLNEEQRWLTESFIPSEHDVVIGRGRACYSHVGNRHLADIVNSMLVAYSAADSKKAKSEIIFEIVMKVREISPEGGFVKLDKSTGRYFEVGNHLAREKVSQTFRDALSQKYKSSTSAKAYRRKQERLFRRDRSKYGQAFLNGSYVKTPRGQTAAQLLPPRFTECRTMSPTLDVTKLPRYGSLDPLLVPMPCLCQKIPFPARMNHANMLFPSTEWMALGLAINYENSGRRQPASQYN